MQELQGQVGEVFECVGFHNVQARVAVLQQLR